VRTNVYLVIDRLGQLGSVPAKPKSSDRLRNDHHRSYLGAIQRPGFALTAFNHVRALVGGRFEDIALEIQTRSDIEGVAVPEHIQDFVASHTGPTGSSRCGLPEPVS